MAGRFKIVVAIAAGVTALSAGPLGLGAEAQTIRDLMVCRASAARVALSPSAVVEPVVANDQLNPCVHEQDQLIVLPVGTLAVVEGLGAATKSAVSRNTATSGAEARVASAFVFLGGTPITVAGAFSQVTDTCTVGAEGTRSRKVTQGSRVALIQIGNRSFVNVTKAQTIDLGAVKVHLNRRVSGGHQQAVAIQLGSGVPVVLAESIAANVFPCERKGDTDPK